MKLEIREELEFDLLHPLENAFVTWFSQEDNKRHIKDALLLGYTVVENGIQRYVSSQMQANQDSNIYNALDEEKKKYQKSLKELNDLYETNLASLQKSMNTDTIRSILEKEYENRITVTQLNTEREIEKKYQKDIIDLHKYKSMYEDLKRECELTTKSDLAQKIRDLEDLVDTKERELSVLKKCNHAKGNKGESIIIESLKTLFPSCEFYDTSKEKHAGDIHMIFGESREMIMIESKFKDTITRQDVEKFYHDVGFLQETQRQIRAAVFVSILTKNIPQIGNVKLDVVKGVPVLFIGFANEAEFESMFPYYMHLSFELAAYMSKSLQNVDRVHDLMKQVTPLVDQLKRVKNTVDKLRHTQLVQMNNTVIELDNSVKDILNSLLSLISGNGSQMRKYIATPNNSSCNVTSFVCSICDKPFGSQRALSIHNKVHNKPT